MCGIAGFIDSSHQGDTAWIRQTALAMASSISHRGPDDADTWSDVENGLGLGFRRLAIIDLSSTGMQPMISHCQRFVIVYNGEIYNTKEIREQLVGTRFRGHSDTEVVLEACAAWGIEETASKLNGMFAFAIWDRQQRSLSLVRDRLGIKPLYWGSFNNLFLFASEIKAIKKHPGWKQEIDRNTLATFMQYRYIPSPRSIYKGIHKLEPGHIITLRAGCEPEESIYWSITDTIQGRSSSTFQASDDEAISMLDLLLNDAVGRRMVADVPVGAFLSGGIDSATVVALMQNNSKQPAKTFTIGFDDENYNEAHYASKIAAHLGTEHTELYVDAKQARDIIPLLPFMYDEPFADSSQIPTFLVSQMTREHVTVALSGDGGDELFAGYNRYQSADLLRRWTNPIKDPFRKGLIGILRSLSPKSWNLLLGFLCKGDKPCYPGHKLHHLAAILSAGDDNIYRQLISEWNNPGELVLQSSYNDDSIWAAAQLNLLQDPVEQLQYLDTLNYLPDDILTKVDRASMAVSLEARTPILDHRVVEFAWNLPMQFKIRKKERKWLLRQVLYNYVPQELMDRPKTGFKIPIGDWLGGSLRDWAEHLLDKRRLTEQGFLDPIMVHERWNAHIAGHSNWKGSLWNVLMFQAWLETQ